MVFSKYILKFLINGFLDCSIGLIQRTKNKRTILFNFHEAKKKVLSFSRPKDSKSFLLFFFLIFFSWASYKKAPTIFTIMLTIFFPQLIDDTKLSPTSSHNDHRMTMTWPTVSSDSLCLKCLQLNLMEGKQTSLYKRSSPFSHWFNHIIKHI